MIKKLTIRNFKSFKEQTTILIKPLTVLIGTNSSGKSNILRLIRLLQASYSDGRNYELLKSVPSEVEFEDITDLAFLNNDSPVEIEIVGDLASDVFDDDERPVTYLGEASIHVEVSKEKQIFRFRSNQNQALTKRRKSGMEVLAEATTGEFTIDLRALGRTYFEREMEKIDPNWKEVISTLLSKALSRTISQENLETDITGWIDKYLHHIYSPRVQGLQMHPMSRDIFLEEKMDYIFDPDKSEFPREEQIRIRYGYSSNEDKPEALRNGFLRAEQLLDNPAYLEHRVDIGWLICDTLLDVICDVWEQLSSDIANVIEKEIHWTSQELFGNIVMTGPLRGKPKRFYTKEELQRDFLQWPMKDVISHEQLVRIARVISTHLPLLGVDVELVFEKISSKHGTPSIYSVILRDRSTNAYHNIADVGFGISQVIPIMMALNYDLRNRLIVVEQPEIHLHPKAQTGLADILIKTSDFSDQDGSKASFQRSILRVVETHSEHLVHGIQILVANREISREDVAIYHVSKDQKGETTAKLMELDEKGCLMEKWPEGFFDQTYLESIELMAKRN